MRPLGRPIEKNLPTEFLDSIKIFWQPLVEKATFRIKTSFKLGLCTFLDEALRMNLRMYIVELRSSKKR